MIELIAKVTYKNRMGDSSDTMADKRLYLGFDFSTQQVPMKTSRNTVETGYYT